MIKIASIILFHCFGALAAVLAPEMPGKPFNSTGFEVVWKVETNALPTKLWVYRVLPSHFSPGAISNLMALGPFTAQDRTNILSPTLNHPTALYFVKPVEGRQLGIYPHLGYIEYRDRQADNPLDAQGVPNEAEAVKLATNYLRRLDIDFAQLATKPNSSELSVSTSTNMVSFQGTNGTRVRQTTLTSASFARKLDGIDFRGSSGFFVEFGHHGRIHVLRLEWRNLQREKEYPIASSTAFSEWLKTGKCGWLIPSRDLQRIDWNWAQKVTVIGMTPLYLGESRDIMQDRVYPFAELQTAVDVAPGTPAPPNIKVRICSPIIEDTPASKPK